MLERVRKPSILWQYQRRPICAKQKNRAFRDLIKFRSSIFRWARGPRHPELSFRVARDRCRLLKF